MEQLLADLTTSDYRRYGLYEADTIISRSDRVVLAERIEQLRELIHSEQTRSVIDKLDRLIRNKHAQQSASDQYNISLIGLEVYRDYWLIRTAEQILQAEDVTIQDVIDFLRLDEIIELYIELAKRDTDQFERIANTLLFKQIVTQSSQLDTAFTVNFASLYYTKQQTVNTDYQLKQIRYDLISGLSGLIDQQQISIDTLKQIAVLWLAIRDTVRIYQKLLLHISINDKQLVESDWLIRVWLVQLAKLDSYLDTLESNLDSDAIGSILRASTVYTQLRATIKQFIQSLTETSITRIDAFRIQLALSYADKLKQNDTYNTLQITQDDIDLFEQSLSAVNTDLLSTLNSRIVDTDLNSYRAYVSVLVDPRVSIIPNNSRLAVYKQFVREGYSAGDFASLNQSIIGKLADNSLTLESNNLSSAYQQFESVIDASITINNESDLIDSLVVARKPVAGYLWLLIVYPYATISTLIDRLVLYLYANDTIGFDLLIKQLKLDFSKPIDDSDNLNRLFDAITEISSTVRASYPFINPISIDLLLFDVYRTYWHLINDTVDQQQIVYNRIFEFNDILHIESDQLREHLLSLPTVVAINRLQYNEVQLDTVDTIWSGLIEQTTDESISSDDETAISIERLSQHISGWLRFIVSRLLAILNADSDAYEANRANDTDELRSAISRAFQTYLNRIDTLFTRYFESYQLFEENVWSTRTAITDIYQLKRLFDSWLDLIVNDARDTDIAIQIVSTTDVDTIQAELVDPINNAIAYFSSIHDKLRASIINIQNRFQQLLDVYEQLANLSSSDDQQIQQTLESLASIVDNLLNEIIVAQCATRLGFSALIYDKAGEIDINSICSSSVDPDLADLIQQTQTIKQTLTDLTSDQIRSYTIQTVADWILGYWVNRYAIIELQQADGSAQQLTIASYLNQTKQIDTTYQLHRLLLNLESRYHETAVTASLFRSVIDGYGWYVRVWLESNIASLINLYELQNLIRLHIVALESLFADTTESNDQLAKLIADTIIRIELEPAQYEQLKSIIQSATINFSYDTITDTNKPIIGISISALRVNTTIYSILKPYLGIVNQQLFTSDNADRLVTIIEKLLQIVWGYARDSEERRSSDTLSEFVTRIATAYNRLLKLRQHLIDLNLDTDLTIRVLDHLLILYDLSISIIIQTALYSDEQFVSAERLLIAIEYLARYGYTTIGYTEASLFGWIMLTILRAEQLIPDIDLSRIFSLLNAINITQNQLDTQLTQLIQTISLKLLDNVDITRATVNQLGVTQSNSEIDKKLSALQTTIASIKSELDQLRINLNSLYTDYFYPLLLLSQL